MSCRRNGLSFIYLAPAAGNRKKGRTFGRRVYGVSGGRSGVGEGYNYPHLTYAVAPFVFSHDILPTKKESSQKSNKKTITHTYHVSIVFIAYERNDIHSQRDYTNVIKGQ